MEAYIKIKFEDLNNNKHEMRVCLNRLVLHKEDIFCNGKLNETIYYLGIAGVSYLNKTLTYRITEESYNDIEKFLVRFMDDSMK